MYKMGRKSSSIDEQRIYRFRQTGRHLVLRQLRVQYGLAIADLTAVSHTSYTLCEELQAFLRRLISCLARQCFIETMTVVDVQTSKVITNQLLLCELSAVYRVLRNLFLVI